MNNIYVLTADLYLEYDGIKVYLLGVFSSEQNAEEYKDIVKAQTGFSENQFTITEVPLDAGLEIYPAGPYEYRTEFELGRYVD